MSTADIVHALAAEPDEAIYPGSDDEPMAETGLHAMLLLNLVATLRHWFSRRPDVYVIGNIFLYYEDGNPKARRCPDVMVIKGITPQAEERRSFFTWREKVVPTVIFELTSLKTADEDIGPKFELYEKLGVQEYFLFDPFGHSLDCPLNGYRLVDGKYELLREQADGSIVSQELGLRLISEGEQLRLYEIDTNQPVLAPPEAYEELSELRVQLEQSEARFEQEHERAEREAREKEEALRRLAAVEQELTLFRSKIGESR